MGQFRDELCSRRTWSSFTARLLIRFGSRCYSSCLSARLVYWVYLRRALVYLDPTAVIPERVQLAFDVMTEGVVVLDRAGRVLLANSAFRALPGDDAVDPVGKPLSTLPWLAAGLAAEAAEHPWAKDDRRWRTANGPRCRSRCTRLKAERP